MSELSTKDYPYAPARPAPVTATAASHTATPLSPTTTAANPTPPGPSRQVSLDDEGRKERGGVRREILPEEHISSRYY
jgi:hypothetical protein